MTKLIHTRSKIFFANPYVVRVEYGKDESLDSASADYRKLTRRAYKIIQGTWGFCNIEYEQVKTKNDNNNPAPPGIGHFNGMNNNQILASLFDSDYVHVLRGYFCFQNELDVLQFRLMIDTKAIQVHMWPDKRLFTIHEFIDES
jgi:hypothetical protein